MGAKRLLRTERAANVRTVATSSKELQKFADKQLAGVNLREAKRKWKAGLPVTLKQMAVALELGYSTVRQYAKMSGFPMLKGVVFPRQFDRWIGECFKSQSAGATEKPVCTGGEMVRGRESAPQLPIRAQKLRSDAGLTK